MTSATKIAGILKRLGDAHYQAADELIALAAEQPGPDAVPHAASAPAPADPPTFEDVLAASGGTEVIEQGSEAMCPKHRKAYTEGKYGPYCTSMTDDPAWANSKGYCTITPKNAAQYLRVKAAA